MQMLRPDLCYLLTDMHVLHPTIILPPHPRPYALAIPL